MLQRSSFEPCSVCQEFLTLFGSPTVGSGRIPNPARKWWQPWAKITCPACNGSGFNNGASLTAQLAATAANTLAEDDAFGASIVLQVCSSMRKRAVEGGPFTIHGIEVRASRERPELRVVD